MERSPPTVSSVCSPLPDNIDDKENASKTFNSLSSGPNPQHQRSEMHARNVPGVALCIDHSSCGLDHSRHAGEEKGIPNNLQGLTLPNIGNDNSSTQHFPLDDAIAGSGSGSDSSEEEQGYVYYPEGGDAFISSESDDEDLEDELQGDPLLPGYNLTRQSEEPVCTNRNTESPFSIGDISEASSQVSASATPRSDVSSKHSFCETPDKKKKALKVMPVLDYEENGGDEEYSYSSKMGARGCDFDHSQEAKHGHVHYDLDCGASIYSDHTITSTGELSNAKNAYGESALHLACSEGFFDGVKILVESGADVNALDERGRSPLHAACQAAKKGDNNGAYRAVLFLLHSGANINFQDKLGMTPLHFAALSGSERVILELMAWGAEQVRNVDGNTPLHLAALRKHSSAMRCLMLKEESMGVIPEDEILDDHHASPPPHSNQQTVTVPHYSQQRGGFVEYDVPTKHLRDVPDEEDEVSVEHSCYDHNLRPREQTQYSVINQAVPSVSYTNGDYYYDQSPYQDQTCTEQQAVPNYTSSHAYDPYYQQHGEWHHQGYHPHTTQEPWVQYYTADGSVYYHHRQSGVSTWERPNAYIVDGNQGYQWPRKTQMGASYPSQEYNPYPYNDFPRPAEHLAPINSYPRPFSSVPQQTNDISSSSDEEDEQLFEDACPDPDNSAASKPTHCSPEIDLAKNNFPAFDPSEQKTKRHLAIFDRFLTNALKASEVQATQPSSIRRIKRALSNGWPGPVPQEELEELMELAEDSNDNELKGVALFAAVASGDLKMVEDLMLMDVQLSQVDVLGRTILHHACKRGNTALVALICSNNINIDATDLQGNTPLHVASECGHLGVLTYLLESAADVNAANLQGDTPLHLASFGHLACQEKLLEYGASTNTVNKHGWNPYYNTLRSAGRKGVKTSKILKSVQLLAEKRGSRDSLEENRLLNDIECLTDSLPEWETDLASVYEEVVWHKEEGGEGKQEDRREPSSLEKAEKSSLIWNIGSFLNRAIWGEKGQEEEKVKNEGKPEAHREKGVALNTNKQSSNDWSPSSEMLEEVISAPPPEDVLIALQNLRKKEQARKLKEHSQPDTAFE